MKNKQWINVVAVVVCMLAGTVMAGNTVKGAEVDSAKALTLYDADDFYGAEGEPDYDAEESDEATNGEDQEPAFGNESDYEDYDDYESPQLETDEVKLIAGGDTFTLYLMNAEEASWSISGGDDGIIKLSEAGNSSVTIKPQKAGRAVVTVTAKGYTMDTGSTLETVTLSCSVLVSEPSLSKSEVEIYMNRKNTASVSLKGIYKNAAYYFEDETISEALDYNTGAITISQPSVVSAQVIDGKLELTGNSRGSSVVVLDVYGKKLRLKVKVYYYTLNKYAINTYKGSQQKTLKVAGTGGKKVSWKSSNKKVATVNSKGVVTAKGVGTAKITATVNKSKLVCIYSVSSSTAYKALRQAKKLTDQNTHYSQIYRMSVGYYDCSSLVYRCYRPLGIRFGATTSWAPTAAAEGQWCVDHGRAIARNAVSISSGKLVPGDTLYFSYGGDNGRYLHISHTAIFAGYAYDDWNGYYGTVIEASASRDGVVERYYYEEDSSIVLIGRPAK